MNQLIEMNQTSLGVWEKTDTLEQIKKIYGKDLNDAEFNVFIQLGKATGLNPFLREVWAVKYAGQAQIFVGRDGYRKAAQANPEYEYHVADAVYSNDVFEMVNGQVNHQYNLKDRGKLMGAYCLVKRKSASKEIFTYVDLNEYSTNKSLWNPTTGKPATMIKKVAEAQALRMAFQEQFAGTYHEYENWKEVEVKPIAVAPIRGVQGLKTMLGIIPPSLDDVKEKIKQAQTMEQLKKVAEAAKDFSEEDKNSLREIYSQQQKTIRSTKHV